MQDEIERVTSDLIPEAWITVEKILTKVEKFEHEPAFGAFTRLLDGPVSLPREIHRAMPS